MVGESDTVATREDAFLIGATVVGSGAFTAAVTQLLTRQRVTAESAKLDAGAEKLHADAAAVITNTVEHLVTLMREQVDRSQAASVEARELAGAAQRATLECEVREKVLADRLTLLERRVAAIAE